MKKLLLIGGPTATGKTGLAVKLAKRFKGELVSADSRQVFQDMDIGTGKDHPPGVKVFLVDVVAPDQLFSVADYVKLAKKVVLGIWKKGKMPILVGGSGFYLKGLLEGIETLGVKPDWKLREKLEKLPVERLGEELRALEKAKWEKMNPSDQKNPRRLIRALEVALSGPVKNTFSPLRPDSVLKIGLTAPLPFLDKKIDERVKKRVKLGQETEIKKLLAKGFGWENSVLGSTLGYQEWEPYFKDKADLSETIKRWCLAEHHFARRQLTWFEKQPGFHWFDLTRKDWEKAVVKRVRAWYIGKNGPKS